MRNRTLFSLGLVLSLAACGDEVSSSKRKTALESTPTTSAAGSGSDAGASPTADPAAEAKRFWTNTVLPAFNKECASCHAEPRFQTASRGPLSIFIYDTMRKLLADGASSTENKLVRKLTNADHHDGGQRCEIGKGVCASVSTWRILELGADAVAQNAKAEVDERAGAVVRVTSAGRVYGWAVDKDDLAASPKIQLYLDAPKGTGVLAAETVADKVGEDGNHPGNHAFFVQVPAAELTGVERPLYIYSGDTLLNAEPATFKAWRPSANGRAYFDAKLAGTISSSCDGCHSASYDFFFGVLITKGPNEGGTALNNAVINKPATANGTSHTGGNRCGSVNGGVCAEFQKWWDVEF